MYSIVYEYTDNIVFIHIIYGTIFVFVETCEYVTYVVYMYMFVAIGHGRTMDAHCGHKECFGTAYTVLGSPVANDIKRPNTADGGTNERFDSASVYYYNIVPRTHRNGR